MMRLNVIFSIVMFSLAAMNITLGVMGGRMFNLGVGIFNIFMGFFFIHMYFKWKGLQAINAELERMRAANVAAMVAMVAGERERAAEAALVAATRRAEEIRASRRANNSSVIARAVANAFKDVTPEMAEKIVANAKEQPIVEAPIKPPEGKLDWNIDPDDVNDDRIMRL